MTQKILVLSRGWIAVAAIWVLFPVASFAQEPVSFPFRDWTEAEVTWMLNQSPWAGRVEVEGSQGTCLYSIRLFSAVPIRLASARRLQLLGREVAGALSDERAAERSYRSAQQEYSDRIVVSLNFDCESFEDLQTVHQVLQNQTRDSLQNSVFLQTERWGTVKIIDYRSPAPDGSGAKFVFPRQRNGRPLVSPQDRRLGFRFLVPGTDQHLQHYWSVAAWIRGGELIH